MKRAGVLKLALNREYLMAVQVVTFLASTPATSFNVMSRQR